MSANPTPVAAGDSEAGDNAPFNALTVLIMVLVGVAGLAALLGLSAFAPDLHQAHSGGGHALSKGATGYSGLVRLAEATGRSPRIVHDPREFTTEDLLVISPEQASVNIGAAMSRAGKPTLVILPKWATVGDPVHAGWVRSAGLLPIAQPVGVMAPGPTFVIERRPAPPGATLVNTDLPAAIRLRAPAQVQVITGVDPAKSQANQSFRPLLTDGHGGVVLAQLDNRALYVLADPDLLNNQALGDEGQAAAALFLLDWLNNTGARGIAFDVSYNGLGDTRGALRLLFEPPFAGGTACLTLALLLAGVSAFGRFGAARPRPRAIAFGKAALVDNAALMVRKAGKEPRMGARYAEMLRHQVVAGKLAGKLDRHPAMDRFAELAQAARAATDRASLLAAARRLHDWKKEITG